MGAVLDIAGLEKRFLLHLQGGAEIAVFDRLDLRLEAGECLALTGPSGRGKSSLLKLVYGTYRANAGGIRVLHGGAWVDIVTAEPRIVLEIRRRTVGYVTQFLRVVPRVPAVEVVAEPLMLRGVGREEALAAAGELLRELNIPERLWPLSPSTFSGGEQQRVNIARGLAAPCPILLLDEPTASLDPENRARVLRLIERRRQAGASIMGIFHDAEDRGAVCTRSFDLVAGG